MGSFWHQIKNRLGSTSQNSFGVEGQPSQGNNVCDLEIPGNIGRHIADELKTSLNALDTHDPDLMLDRLSLLGEQVLRRHLPRQALDLLRAFARRKVPAVVLRGVIQDVHISQATPRQTGFASNAKELAIHTATNLGLLRIMGLAPVSFAHENDGHVVRDVVAREGFAGARSSHGGDVTFSWHSDNPNGRHDHETAVGIRIPGTLSFMGVRNHERAATYVLPIDAVLAQLDPLYEIQLRKSSWKIGPPTSNKQDAELILKDIPILSRDSDGDTVIRFDEGLILNPTHEQKLTLDHLQDAIIKAAAVHQIKPVLDNGDFLILNNNKTLHARKAFKSRDADGRWLRRIYASWSPQQGVTSH